MASNDNQGYLIGIIVLVLLVVGLGLSTYLGFSSSAENADAAKDATDKLSSAKERSKALDFEVQILRAAVGLEGGVGQIGQMMQSIERANFDDITTRARNTVKQYNEDKSKILTEQPGEDITYLKIVESYKTAMAEKHDRVSSIEGKLDSVRLDLAAKVAAHVKETEAKDSTITSIQTQLKEEQDRNRAEEAKINSEMANVTRKFEMKVTQLDNEKEGRALQVKSLEQDKADLDKDNATLKEQIADLTRVNSDIADGSIIRVSPVGNRAFINLGFGDGLKPRQRFNVYDRSKTKFEKYLEKATIEVLRVPDRHMSEVQIVDLASTSDILKSIESDKEAGLMSKQDAKNLTIRVLQARKDADPILTGDHILSEVWDPGYSVSIAVAGVIDIDGTGVSNLARFNNIVRRNGGTVVCSHDSEGNIVGKIDIDTRYIVIGETPKDPAPLKAFSDLLKDAERLKIQKISLKKMLNTLGVQAEAKVQNLDKNIGKQFQPRKAPSRNGNSAYEKN